jgi:DNA-binding IclR family transcriptional regulator
MDVLRLYTVEQHAWTVQAMSDALGSPPSTVYRVVAELVNAGLLEAATESRYRLGAAFVEFDRLTRLTDPLVQHGSAVLQDCVARASIPCVGLLSRLYNATVMCIADAATGPLDFRSSYERGLPMPLTRGATSKAILAQLPARRLATLVNRQRPQDQRAPSPEALRASLAEIRRRGFAVSRGEIDHGLVGIAAPVMVPATGLVASLSLVVRAADLTEGIERSLILMLVSAAALLTDTLSPPRRP